MERVSWITGLKGLAAFLVAFNHFFSGQIRPPHRSFWESPPEQNRRLFQLPPFRLIWAAGAMVPLFMTLSGYSLSLGLLKLRDSGQTVEFFLRLRSAASRRLLRLYFPFVLISVVSQLAFFFGLYDWNLDDDVLQAHQLHGQSYSRQYEHIFHIQWTRGMNLQLWTMPFGLRGSYIVYVTILGLSAWHWTVRVWLLSFMALFALWYSAWDLFGFMSGILLVELRSVFSTASSSQTHGKSPLPPQRHAISCILSSLCFVIGIYLFCLCGEDRLPPEYTILSSIRTSHWTKYNPYVEVQLCLHAIGAPLVVFAISNTPILQKPLLTRPLQYLGKISFAVYLVHEMIFRLWRNPLTWYLWEMVTGEPYPGTDVAMQNPIPFFTAWVGSGLLLGSVVIAAAELVTRVLVHSESVSRISTGADN
ncbi:acyltransferase 3 [Aspergillus californicus]